MGIADKTVANTTTQTSVIPTTGVGNLTFPVNTFEVGKSYRIRGGGIYSTGIVPGTLTVRVKIGSITIASVAITNVISLATGSVWEFECVITFRTIGASGTVMCVGSASYEITSLSRGFAALNNAGSTSTVDTTVTNLIDITVQWSSTSLGLNSITTNLAIIEDL